MSHKRTGRIRPHERDADQSGAILGAELELPADLRARCNATLKLQMNTTCRKDYRNRLKRFLEFWKTKTPLYYAIGAKPVSAEDLLDETKYFVVGSGRSKEGFTEDLIYKGLNADYVHDFLTSAKMRSDGKVKSYQDLRKYKDAILRGAGIAGERIPVEFHERMESFLQAYKRRSEKEGCEDDKPMMFVFHGGSGSSTEDIQFAIEAGVVKTNIDTDTQWGFWLGIRNYEAKYHDYLQAQIGNPEGADKPNKKYYDPRMPLRAGEEEMANRLLQRPLTT